MPVGNRIWGGFWGPAAQGRLGGIPPRRGGCTLTQQQRVEQLLAVLIELRALLQAEGVYRLKSWGHGGL